MTIIWSIQTPHFFRINLNLKSTDDKKSQKKKKKIYTDKVFELNIFVGLKFARKCKQCFYGLRRFLTNSRSAIFFK